MTKLEIYSNYLPYEVKVQHKHGWAIMDSLSDSAVNFDHEEPIYFDEDCKLILRPLSDLTKEEILNLGYSNFENLKSNIDFGFHLNYTTVQWLLKNHFDVFGAIEQGIAININEI